MRFSKPALALTLLLLACGRTIAQTPSLNLSSSVDLNTLTVGDQATINVNLQGLAVGSDFIFVLNSKVLFSSSAFSPVPSSSSSGLTPGPGFFFDPSQVSNFNAVSSLNSSSAIGDYSDSAPNSSFAINENGLYYSFVLQAVQAGTGTIAFDAASTTYAADDTGFNLAPLPAGGALTFTIAPAAVPEPGAYALVVGLSMMGAGFLARHRKTVRQTA